MLAGRFLEDFQPGDQVDSARYTLTERDMRAFAALTLDDNPLHRLDEVMEGSLYGRPVASGMLVQSTALGLLEQTGVHHGTSLAMIEIIRWSFDHPVFVGDTFWARETVLRTRRSTRHPDRGVLTRRVEVFVHDDVLAQSGEMVLLVRARETR